jgi:hypothetical protein
VHDPLAAFAKLGDSRMETCIRQMLAYLLSWYVWLDILTTFIYCIDKHASLTALRTEEVHILVRVYVASRCGLVEHCLIVPCGCGLEGEMMSLILDISLLIRVLRNWSNWRFAGYRNSGAMLCAKTTLLV